MSKKKLCGLDYCPQEEMIGAYANCTACAWGNGSDSETAEEIKGIDDEDRLLKESDVLKAIDKRIKELSKHPEFVRKNGHIDVIGVKKYILAIPDRPQGKWEIEYHGNGWNDYWDYICSNCGKKYERADAVLYKANFCPNCGAQMKGADDGADNI